MSLVSIQRAKNYVMSICALALLSAGASSASAATLSRSIDVNGTPTAVWSMIGPFCAIKVQKDKGPVQK